MTTVSISKKLCVFCPVAVSLTMVSLQAVAVPPNFNGPSSPSALQVQVGPGPTVTPSPWASSTSSDDPRPAQSVLFVAPSGSASGGHATPTWEHAQSMPGQFLYKCKVKDKTTFQDTPCDRSNGTLYWPGGVRAAPHY